MKTLISIICLCFVYGISTQAANDDGDNLYVFTKGVSSAAVYSLDHLDKLTFEENSVRIWYGGGKMDYEYGKISSTCTVEKVCQEAIFNKSRLP